MSTRWAAASEFSPGGVGVATGRWSECGRAGAWRTRFGFQGGATWQSVEGAGGKFFGEKFWVCAVALASDQRGFDIGQGGMRRGAQNGGQVAGWRQDAVASLVLVGGAMDTGTPLFARFLGCRCLFFGERRFFIGMAVAALSGREGRAKRHCTRIDLGQGARRAGGS